MSRTLNSAYFYNSQTELKNKEIKYRPIVRERNWPFIICPSPFMASFISAQDAYDFLIAKGKGFLYERTF